MNMQRAKDWLDITTKTATLMAIAVGAGWAWFQFSVTRTDVPNVELITSAELSKYDDSSNLLIVHVHPKNRGKTLVVLDRQKFTVDVRELSEPFKPGLIDTAVLKPRYREDLMKRFNAGYQIEPATEYDEVVVFLVAAKKTYAVTSTLTLPDNSELDHTAVVR